MNGSLDVLELELRQLGGVVGVGLEEQNDSLVVRLCLAPGAHGDDVRRRAALLARAHAENPLVEVAVDGEAGPPEEAAVAPAAERVRVLAVVRVPTTDELEVHLAHRGRRTIGRHRGAGVATSAVEATLDALAELGVHVPFRHAWSEEVHAGGGRRPAVAVGLAGEQAEHLRYGIAGGASIEEAAVRATLNALNRQVGITGVV